MKELVSNLCTDTDRDLIHIQEELLQDDPLALSACNKLLKQKQDDQKKKIEQEKEHIKEIDKKSMEEFRSQNSKRILEVNDKEGDDEDPSFMPVMILPTKSSRELDIHIANKVYEAESSQQPNPVENKDMASSLTPNSLLSSSNISDDNIRDSSDRRQSNQRKSQESSILFDISKRTKPKEKKPNTSKIFFQKGKLFDDIKLKEEYNFEDSEDNKAVGVTIENDYQEFENLTKTIKIDNMKIEINKVGGSDSTREVNNGNSHAVDPKTNSV